MIRVAEPCLHGNERKYLNQCVDNNQFSSGPFVKRFEEKFASYLGVREAVSCTNGTSALHLALLALGIVPGQQVIVPDLTYVATANAVTYVGAVPVFVDVDPYTWNMDPEQVKKAINPYTAAIIPVHLYGNPVSHDIWDIVEKADHRILIIEDAAEAIGSFYCNNSSRVGTVCDAAAFSFYGNKTITCGEGGMVVFPMADWGRDVVKNAVMQRGQGVDPLAGGYHHVVLGRNYRMTDLQAAVGLAQLENVGWHERARDRINTLYRKELAHTPGIQFQEVLYGATSGNWMFSILTDNALIVSLIKARCHAAKIETRAFFPPLHNLGIYRGLQFHCNGEPVSTDLYNRGITLPTHANLTTDNVLQICDIVKGCVRDA